MAEVVTEVEGQALAVTVTYEVFGSYAPATYEQPADYPEVEPISIVVDRVLEEGPVQEGEDITHLLDADVAGDLAWRAYQEDVEYSRDYD